MINPDEIRSTLEKTLPGSTVNIQDLTGGGDHYQLLVISSSFEGKGLVEQHQIVYGALKEDLGSERIHALALKTMTPKEWEQLGS